MSVLYSPTLRYSDGELRINPEMDSSIGYHQQHCHQPNSGLLRYRSAPSSFLASLVENGSHGCVNEGAYSQRSDEDDSNYVPSSSAEMETMLAKLISSNNGWNSSESLDEYGGKPVKQEAGESVPTHNGYSDASQMIYQNQQVQTLADASLSGGSAFDASFRVSENSNESKLISRNCSNLTRQKSSPAGFFSNLTAENGFSALREGGSFGACDVTNGQSSTSTSGLNGNMKLSSFSRRMPQITENGNESMEGASCVESRNLQGNDNGSSKCFMPSLTSDFWDSSVFNGQKPASDNDEIMFSDALETQDSDFGYQNHHGLTHHLSLPSPSTKMTIDKFLQVQGSVPCKIRAKRGFATHPRSIAERVRRTRISERLRKLQDLFPKSDKQTSTSDMLDLAVDYIKELQNQVQVLKDTKAKCMCSSNQKQ